jgi:DNA-binding CsgD family transcriptional regulator
LRIAIAGLLHETNTFSTLPTNYDDFRAVRGEALLDTSFWRAERLRHDVIPICVAHATPSGRVTEDAFDRFLSEMLEGLRASLPLEPLGELLDTIEHGIVLLRSDAFPCYSNAAAQRLLIADSERGVLAREIRSVSRAALVRSDRRPAEVEVATHAGWYRMRATLLLQKIKEISNRAVLVTIEHAEPTLPSRDFLMRRFAMTAREADVALRLAGGARNAAIASELHISPHTARHHTENVLTKLGVHARAEVARAIVEGSAIEILLRRSVPHR